MVITYFDMFAGIGGFRSGLEAIGGFEYIGCCEIDKYAKQSYAEAGIDKAFGGDGYIDPNSTAQHGLKPFMKVIYRRLTTESEGFSIQQAQA